MRSKRGMQWVWPLVLILASSALGEETHPLLKPGSALPTLTGQTLNGKSLEIPASDRGEVAVAIFSFSRAGGRDARNWGQRFSKDYPHLVVYDVIFLESVPRLFRPMVAAAIRSGMPASMQDRTLLLYRQQTLWEHMLQLKEDNYACVIVLGPTGLLRWMSSGPFTEAVYARLRAEVGP